NRPLLTSHIHSFPTRRSSDLIVNSLVKDIIMPPIGLITGGLDFSNKFIVLKAAKDGTTSFPSLDAATKAGATTWNYGNFTTLVRSEEHTSELQSRFDLVCRLL